MVRQIRGRLQSLAGRYRGRRCFIMGNGPSLNRMNLELLRDDLVWGLNKCYLLFDRITWRPAFYVAVDERVVPDSAEEIAALIVALPLTRFFFPVHFRHERVLPSAKRVFWYRERLLSEEDRPEQQFSMDAARWVSSVRTVTIAALQLAVHLGCNPIYLIGCDTDYAIPPTVQREGGDPDKFVSQLDDDPNHFDPRYFGAGSRWHVPNTDRMIQHFTIADTICRQHGIRIFNATAGGRLEVFTRVSYEDLFPVS